MGSAFLHLVNWNCVASQTVSSDFFFFFLHVFETGWWVGEEKVVVYYWNRQSLILLVIVDFNVECPLLFKTSTLLPWIQCILMPKHRYFIIRSKRRSDSLQFTNIDDWRHAPKAKTPSYTFMTQQPTAFLFHTLLLLPRTWEPSCGLHSYVLGSYPLFHTISLFYNLKTRQWIPQLN